MSYILIHGLVSVSIEIDDIGCPEVCIWDETTGVEITDKVQEKAKWPLLKVALAHVAGGDEALYGAAFSMAKAVACNLSWDANFWNTVDADWRTELYSYDDWLVEQGRPVSLEEHSREWRRRLALIEAPKLTLKAKRAAMSIRRAEFGGARPQLVLKLIERGDPYLCAECSSPDSITVDHVVPLSRGGGDELDNLRFLCGPCNSRKRDRIAA